MTIERAIDILKGKTISNTRAELDEAEKMATRSLEIVNELEALIEVSFDTDTYKYDSNVLTAINDFRSIAKLCKKRVENNF